MFTTSLPWLKGENLAKVMGLGLRRWIGWHEGQDHIRTG